MVFSELYSAYYNVVAKILREIIRGSAEKNAVYRIIKENAFEESVLSIPPAIKDERWQIITKDLKTPVKHIPSMPLTVLEKRWLKAVLEDERIKLFDFNIDGLDDVTPLFTKDDYRVYDKYSDGDDFTDKEYIKNFRTILYAAKNSLPVEAEMLNRKGNSIRLKFVPKRIEYSEKDDKFRVIASGSRHIATVNVARLTKCRIYDGEFIIRQSRREAARSSVTMIVNDERNALERTMLHFAHFEKRVEKIGGRKYKLIVEYDCDDESEMVIRVLSFGPLVEVVEPESFRELIKDKLIKQLRCGLK